jgi:MarR family transcriptional regulator, organic hydroperoxide resistance regulator
MRASGKLSPPPSEGGYLVAKAHQIGGRVFNRLLKEAGDGAINPSQGRILFALWKGEGMRVSDLAKETALEPSTLTSMLDRLEEAGLVKRSPSPGDRRALLVECAEGGRALMSRYGSVSERMTELFYGDMGAEEIAGFEAALRKVVSNLSRAEAQLAK